MPIEAKLLLKSVGPYSPPIGTFRLRYPKFIHGEFMTHRAFSRNASSSRAIPVSKNLDEVRCAELRAQPVWWGREQKGMQSGAELAPEEIIQAKTDWETAALQATSIAERMTFSGVHKSIVNRLLEPFLHINVIATSCEPGLMNFFGLRLDRAAQPEIRVLAELMWKEWNETEIRNLKPDCDEWHLPFIDPEDVDRSFGVYHVTPGELVVWARKVSAARCARVSYLSFETEKRSTIEEDLRLYERLAGASPMHLSPLEHQASPDLYFEWHGPGESHWYKPHLHGNLPGWIQFRKTIPGEDIAVLPDYSQELIRR